MVGTEESRMAEAKKFSTTVGGRTVTLETGKLAQLAGGAVAIRVGETLLLAAATMSREPRLGIDFFPLSVDYEERLYAIGKIPGSFFRREGRPSEQAILTSRLIDLPEQMAREVGKTPRDYQKFVLDPVLVQEIEGKARDRMAAAVSTPNKAERNTAMDALTQEILESYEDSKVAVPGDIKAIL